MTTDVGSLRPGTTPRDDDAALPDEVLAASHRRAVVRARTSRQLERSTLRRRVWPTIVVTSVAMVATGLANTFVGATLPVVTTTTTTTEPVYVSRQAAVNAHALSRLSATLASDRRIIAALRANARDASATASSVAATALAAINRATTSRHDAAVAASSAAPGLPSVNSASATTRTVTSAPAPVAAPTTPPAPVSTAAAPVVVPATPPPATNATTGASGAG